MSNKNILDNKELHSAFIRPLREKIIWMSDLDSKPLEIDFKPPLPRFIRLYLYNVTSPPGGRTLGEHKIQLIVPGQLRKERASFDTSDHRIIILAGYHAELNIFVLWDANMYPQFSYSRNVQVKPETVYSALAGKIGKQKRHIKQQGTEIVLTATPDNLYETLLLRWDITCRGLIGD